MTNPRGGAPRRGAARWGVAVALAAILAFAAACAGGGGTGEAPSSETAGASESAPPPSRSEAAPSEATAGGTPPSEGSPAPSEAAVIPFAATIDNQKNARPQSGLSGARIVIEALAEGGITRYFAIFDGDPGEPVGPIRSTRIYFNKLSWLWNLPVAHAGGNVDALADFKRRPAYDIDGIFTNGGAFYRTKDRKAPHNMYTDLDRIQKVLASRDVDPTVPEYRVAAAPDADTASGVRIDYGSATPYVVEWRTSVDGRWQRYIDGSPDRAVDGRVLEADNVLVIVAPTRPDEDPFTPGSIDIDWTKPGPAWLFRNGRVATGTWSFTPTEISVTSEAGRTVGFTSGNLWVEVVPDAGDVTLLAGDESR